MVLFLADIHEIRTTLSRSTSVSHIPHSAVSRAKTWTVTSTITREVPGHNKSTADYRPTTTANTIQSNLRRPTPGQSVVDTSRTSVSKLRKSFEAVVQQELETSQLKSARTSAKLPGVPSMKEIVPSILTNTMDGSQDKPSVDALDEHTTDAAQDDTSSAPKSFGFLRLKSPVWDKIHKGPARPEGSTPGRHPRRSKKSQDKTVKSSLAVPLSLSTKQDGPQDDEVSPTNSAGPGTPRMVSAESPPPDRIALPPDNVRAPTSTLPQHALTGNSEAETPANPPEQSPTRRKSKVEDLKSMFDRKKHSVAGDHTEDQGVPATCSIFPSPFRRESTNQPSPVKEKVSIFEGLVKPGPTLPPPVSAETNPDQSDSQPFIAGTELLAGKKGPMGWLTKPFRKMSMHRGNDMADSQRTSNGDNSATNEPPKELDLVAPEPVPDEVVLNGQDTASKDTQLQAQH